MLDRYGDILISAAQAPGRMETGMGKVKNSARKVEDWASWIRDYRKQLQYTQADLAYRLNVDQAQISRWETGRCVPKTPQQHKLRRLFGLDRGFYGGDAIRQIIDVSPNILGLADRDLNTFAVSPGLAANHGVERSFFLNFNYGDYRPLMEAVERLVGNLEDLKSGRVRWARWSGQIRRLHDKTLFWAETTLSTITLENIGPCLFTDSRLVETEAAIEELKQRPSWVEWA